MLTSAGHFLYNYGCRLWKFLFAGFSSLSRIPRIMLMCPVERHKVAFLNIFESIGPYNPNFRIIHVIIIKMSNQILQFKIRPKICSFDEFNKFDAHIRRSCIPDPLPWPGYKQHEQQQICEIVCRLVKYFLDAATNCILEVSVELWRRVIQQPGTLPV